MRRYAPIGIRIDHRFGRHVGLDLADVGFVHFDVDLQRFHIDYRAHTSARKIATRRQRRDDLTHLRGLFRDHTAERRTHHRVTEIHLRLIW